MNRIITGYRVDAPPLIRQNAASRFDFLKARFLMRLLLLGAFAVLLSIFYIWSRVQMVKVGYELSEYTMEQEALIVENKRLRMELSFLKTPGRLKAFAGENLRMAFPEQDRIVPIDYESPDR